MTEYTITLKQHGASLLVSGLPPGTLGKVKEALDRHYHRPAGLPPRGERPTIPVHEPRYAEVEGVVRAAIGNECVVHFPRDVQSFKFDRIEYA